MSIMMSIAVLLIYGYINGAYILAHRRKIRFLTALIYFWPIVLRIKSRGNE